MYKSLKRYFFIVYNLLKFSLNKRIKFGEKLRCIGRIETQLKNNSRLKIGHQFTLVSGEMINPLGRNMRSAIRIDENATICIGNHVGMSCVVLWAKNKIFIGNNVTIGADVMIFDTDMHSLDYMLRRDHITDASNAKVMPVSIEDDVFIGARSIITKGCTIGKRSIVAAGSVVTKSIPEDEIWGGNPAKFIKKINT